LEDHWEGFFKALYTDIAKEQGIDDKSVHLRQKTFG
jgi:hypothetical protein